MRPCESSGPALPHHTRFVVDGPTRDAILARRRGWPQNGARFKLESWGTIINILALVWGGLMIINFALWQTDTFGASERGRIAREKLEADMATGETIIG